MSAQAVHSQLAQYHQQLTLTGKGMHDGCLCTCTSVWVICLWIKGERAAAIFIERVQ